MVGKRVQFDDETWGAIEAVARKNRRSFQDLAEEAFSDFLKKHRQSVGLRAALEQSVSKKPAKSRIRKKA